MIIRGFNNINLLKELNDAVENLEHPYNWENYCSSCDNFETINCPFREKVNFDTKWKNIKCNNFYD